MIFIFGAQKERKRLCPLLDAHCYRCKQGTTWDWLRVTDWISLFFVRVLPLRSKAYLACKGCGDTLLLQVNEARGIRNLQRLSPQRSRQLHDHLVKRLEEHQFRGKTVAQREYLKSTHRPR